MAHISSFGLVEVVGTSDRDVFTGRLGTVFFGRQGGDVFRSNPEISALVDDQVFYGGSGSDTYVVRPGTSVTIGDGSGSRGDTVRSSGIGFGLDTTSVVEIDGRHLFAADFGSDTGFLILDWLDPQRMVERFELADGVAVLGVNLTARDIRSAPNYLGNFTLEEIFAQEGLPPGSADLFRDIVRSSFERAAELETVPQPELVQITGTFGNDVLIGDGRAEIISGLAGTDFIAGRAGADQIRGGGSSDVIEGNAGPDAIAGGAGDDTISGGAGNDSVSGGAGNDSIDGNLGIDDLVGDAGADRIAGGDGDDRITGGSGADMLLGNDGADRVIGGGGTDEVYGNLDADILSGGDGADRVFGGESDDRLDGGDGDDLLSGDQGSDVLRGGAGDDELSGGIDDDSLFAGSGDDVLRGGAGDDELSGGIDDDSLLAGTGDDVLRGGRGDDRLEGSGGDDTLLGDPGADVLDGGAGADTLTGGDGRDVFALSALDPEPDVVSDFNPDDGDRLDLSRVLPGLTVSDDLADFVRLSVAVEGTTVAVDPAGAGSDFQDAFLLQDVAIGSLTAFELGLLEPPTRPGALNGGNGFAIDGLPASQLGWSVSGAGDATGDGFADLVLGAPHADPDGLEGPDLGAAHVLFGRPGDFASRIDLAALQDSQGVTLTQPGNFGATVGGGGDVDADGLADVLVGAVSLPFGGSPEGGLARVVFGDGVGLAVENGFAIDGDAILAVANAGDVNGDGLADIVVGAGDAMAGGLEGAGRAYVVFGRADGAAVNLSEVAAGAGGFAIDGAIELGHAGRAVGGAGDVNADGLADVIIGAPSADPNGSDSGTAYVVFGRAGGEAVRLGEVADGDGGFAIDGIAAFDEAGTSVSGAGDVDGDGLADLIVGAPFADPSGAETGQAYVVFGKPNGALVELSGVVAGSGGFAINGTGDFLAGDPFEGDRAGFSVDGAGDVNGDGRDDLIIGAPGRSGPSGAFVLYGKADGDPVELTDLRAAEGGFAFQIRADLERLGFSVAGAGDVNGDGFADVASGAPTGRIGFGADGSAYVLFGGDFTGAADRLGTAADDVLDGTAANETLVGGRGDDVIVGNGGLDVLIGGAGDDVLALPDPSPMEGLGAGGGRLVGGTGVDTIRLDGIGAGLDLTAIADTRVNGIEAIDLDGDGNALTLDLREVLNASDTSNTLTVFGDETNAVTGAFPGGAIGASTIDGVTFTTFTVGRAELLVQIGIDASGVETAVA